MENNFDGTPTQEDKENENASYPISQQETSQGAHLHHPTLGDSAGPSAGQFEHYSYNQALAHHLFSRELPPEHRHKVVEKASRLYGIAYELNEEANNDDDKPSSQSMLLSLAIINNLGVIHADHNAQLSKKFFGHLLTVVIFLVDSQICENLHNFLDGFLHNVTMNSNTNHAAAA